jgi:hypothetical protein
MEIWKVIKQTPNYEVSNLGSIRKIGTTKILKGSLCGKRNGKYRYSKHGLINDAERIFNLSHRIVAMTFIDNPNNYAQVNHIDENTFNNCVSNLEWVSNQQNSRHSNKRKINQLSLDGNVIKTYEGLFEIGDAGFDKPKVCEVLSSKYKRQIHKGYKWKYV